ncbi:MAG: sugar transferase, partial [Duncaniella sp.]|nr:sugar transferase [Duncaniella sp.]
IDVAAADCGLLIAAPLIGVLALVIRRQSPGPVIYSQERIGYRRKPFRIHKLRSMRLDAEADNTPRLSSDDDARILPIGRLMRHYRLDELPNLWNVLVGEMSLVGPRPERQYFISQIMKEAPYYALLHRVRPGVTSWGMVRYGYASTVDDMIKRLKYDILYVQNLSLEVDLKILLYTFRTLLRGEGK